jgi:7-carboxy-7-deazaguanine synthase
MNMATVLLSELYLSLQGESSWAGRPCVMVRLAGCPLSCRWCDTPQAKQGGETTTVEEVVQRVREPGVELVEVTGGEPLAQPATPRLLTALCEAGLTVLLETNGCEDISQVDPRVHVIMDLKCPSSGMEGHTRWENLARLKPGDEVKFVIADRHDYEYAREIIHRHELARRLTVLLSPVWGMMEPCELAAWMLADRLPARFQLQLHKCLWGPEATGV